MHLKLKIVRFDLREHSVLIRMFTDKVTEEMLAFHDENGNVPKLPDDSPERTRTDLYVNVPIPPPEDLEKWLLYNYGHHCRAWLEDQEKIVDPAVDTSMSSILPKIGKVIDAPSRPVIAAGPPNVIQVRRRRTPLTSIPQTEL